jgi:ADP-ribose pyrophosphatase
MGNSVKSIYRGRIIDLGLERVRLPNGRETELEIVRHPGGAAVVAVDQDTQVCLLHQYRHAANGWLLELPAGKRDEGEDPASTARRELAEEAGVGATGWESLGDMLSSPGVLAETIHLFLATDLHAAEQRLGRDELLEVRWVPFDLALTWASSGRIRDAKTLVGLYRARDRLRRPWPGG